MFPQKSGGAHAIAHCHHDDVSANLSSTTPGPSVFPGHFQVTDKGQLGAIAVAWAWTVVAPTFPASAPPAAQLCWTGARVSAHDVQM